MHEYFFLNQDCWQLFDRRLFTQPGCIYCCYSKHVPIIIFCNVEKLRTSIKHRYKSYCQTHYARALFQPSHAFPPLLHGTYLHAILLAYFVQDFRWWCLHFVVIVTRSSMYVRGRCWYFDKVSCMDMVGSLFQWIATLALASIERLAKLKKKMLAKFLKEITIMKNISLKDECITEMLALISHYFYYFRYI